MAVGKAEVINVLTWGLKTAFWRPHSLRIIQKSINSFLNNPLRTKLVFNVNNLTFKVGYNPRTASLSVSVQNLQKFGLPLP